MADQIEQMGVTIENHQKQIEELQGKYDGQVQQCSDLSNKLHETQKDLNQSNKLLADTKDELKQSQYSLKEKDFIISEQKKAENALAHQACALRADLEKAQKDNAELFAKIAREDRLNADNRSTVNSFQADLAQQLESLHTLLSGSLSRQDEHLQCVENICNSFLKEHDKASIELKKKLSASKALYISHFEAVQNVVKLHKAGSTAALEELSALASTNSQSIGEFLAAEAIEVNSIFDDLQQTLSSHQGEMAHLARELRQRFNASLQQLENTSESLHGYVEKMLEESKRLESHVTKVDSIHTTCIAEFQKAFEEQSRSEKEKLISDVATLVSDCMRRQKEMVGAHLCDFEHSVIGNKVFLNDHVSKMDGITTDLKRKWDDCFSQAESSFKDNADFSAVKHCRMELLLQKCVNTADAALKQWQRTQESLDDMRNQHASTISSHVRNISDSNEQHDADIESARISVEEDIRLNSEDIIKCYNGLSEKERSSVSEIQTTSRAHSETVVNLCREYSQQAACIERHAIDTFTQKYMDYEPTGTTPVRCEPDIPSKGKIESLRAMPMESLQEEFRENNSYASSQGKELKPSLIPRSPLTHIN